MLRRLGWLLTVVTVAALALVTAGCTGGSTGRAGAGFVPPDGGIVVVPPAKRQAPVELTGTTLQGDRIDLARFRGRPVVINVWGSWCSPCRKEAPALQSASVELATRGVKTLGINTQDDDATKALAFERRFGITYPSVVDSGTLLLQLRGAVPPNAIPTTLVLDDRGRIAARLSAPVTRTTLLDLVHDATGV